jgi:hypothetical protein
VKIAQESTIELQKQIAVTQHEHDAALLAEMITKKDALQQEEVTLYKEQIRDLLKDKREEQNKKYKPMPIIITALFGLASLYILLSKKYPDETTKWALGTLGVIAGFWLGGV